MTDEKGEREILANYDLECPFLNLQDFLLRYLGEVDRAPTKEEASSSAARLIGEGTDFMYPAVYLWNAKEQYLELRGAANYQVSLPVIQPSEGVVGRCYRTKEVQVVDDVREDPDYLSDPVGMRSELAVPMIWHDKVLGILNVGSPDVEGFKPMDVRFAMLLGGILGSVCSHLEGERALQESLEQNRDHRRNLALTQQALNRSLDTLMKSKQEVETYSHFKQILLNVLSEQLFRCRSSEELYKLMGDTLVEHCGYKSLLIYGRYHRSFPLEQVFLHGNFSSSPFKKAVYFQEKKGLIGEALKSYKPYFCNDTTKDPRFIRDQVSQFALSEMVFPIVYENFVWGVLVIIADTKDAFSKQDRETVSIAANSMAVVLENLSNLRRLRRELQGMRFLDDVANALLGERDNWEIARKAIAFLTSRLPDILTHICLIHGESCQMVASSFFPPEDFQRKSQEFFESLGGPVYRALKNGDMLNIDNVKKCEGYIDTSPYTQSALLVPILNQGNGEVLGLILLERSEVGAFDREEEDLFHLLGRHLGAILAVNRLLDKEEEKAHKDQLTGIWNRRFLMQHLENYVEPLASQGESCCVIMVDMRKFKEINDTYGHAMGDEVLVKSARAMSEQVPHGVVGRYGGDEFLIVLTGCPEESMSALVASIGVAMEKLTFSEPLLQAQANFGVAFFGKDGETTDQVLKAADKRMYADKGRPLPPKNRYGVAQS